MYLTHIPTWLQSCYPSYHWRIPTQEKVVYLTFDDGPTEEVTEWTLDQLAQYKAKATFFVIGKNVQQHPSILQEILSQGHIVGNHTFTHNNGRQTATEDYLQSIQQTQDICKKHGDITPTLFRPPYGRMTWAQIQEVKKQFPIVMMDVISADFDLRKEGEECTNLVCESSQEGSIILFHDSVKAFPRLEKALPEVLSHFARLGYRFESIPALPLARV